MAADVRDFSCCRDQTLNKEMKAAPRQQDFTVGVINIGLAQYTSGSVK